MGGRSELIVMHHRRHQPGEDPLGAFIAHEGSCTGQQIVPEITRVWHGRNTIQFRDGGNDKCGLA